MNKIIDPVDKLMKLSGEDFNEVILDPKYNKANLRELMRRFHSELKIHKKAYEYIYEENEKLEEELENLKNKKNNY